MQHDDSETPLGLLMACHERIRRYLGGLDALIALEDPEDPRARPTARDCARYFGEALPLHAEDEEASLVPRLRALDLGPRVIEALETMQRQHVAIEEQLPALVAQLQRRAEAEVVDLAPLAGPFSALLLQHIAAEEEVLFGHIERLDPTEQRAFVREIRGRRRR